MEKSISAVIRNTNHRVLIEAVIEQLGYDPAEENEELTGTLSDIRSHGIDGGYSGFIYYTDTHKFAIDNRKQIVALLDEMADDMGIEVNDMVAGFGVFRNSPMDKEDKRDLRNYLGGGPVEQGTITNVMAWFAAEEVARMFE